jgi:hypothetical protein
VRLDGQSIVVAVMLIYSLSLSLSLSLPRLGKQVSTADLSTGDDFDFDDDFDDSAGHAGGAGLVPAPDVVAPLEEECVGMWCGAPRLNSVVGRSAAVGTQVLSWAPRPRGCRATASELRQRVWLLDPGEYPSFGRLYAVISVRIEHTRALSR